MEEMLITRFRELREMGIEPDVELVLASIEPDRRAPSTSLAQPVHDGPGSRERRGDGRPSSAEAPREAARGLAGA